MVVHSTGVLLCRPQVHRETYSMACCCHICTQLHDEADAK